MRFPFRALGRLALVLAVVAPNLCLSTANRKDKPIRDAPLRADLRPPVLYMRGFAQELTPFARRPDDPRWAAVGWALDALNAQLGQSE